jgi:hypothetical protein
LSKCNKTTVCKLPKIGIEKTKIFFCELSIPCDYTPNS